MRRFHSTRHSVLRQRSARRPVCVLLAAAVAWSCSSGRIGLHEVDPLTAYASSSINVLARYEPSNSTQIIMRRYDLQRRFRTAPEASIADLHACVAAGRCGSDELFALAELSFLHAVRLGRPGPKAPTASQSPLSMGRLIARAADAPTPPDVAASHSYFLAAAVYAYAFLFPDEAPEQVTLIDPRARIAADIYDRALAEVFVRGGEGNGGLASRDATLPFGTVHIDFDPAQLTWGKRQLINLRWAGAAEIEGLINRYRQAGIGSPVVAQTQLRSKRFDFVNHDAWVPATLVLRLDRPRKQLADGHLEAILELRTATHAQPMEIGSSEYPLTTERSVALAATLEQSRFWESELQRFLGHAIGVDKNSNLFAQEPYVSGKIPAVFVHGTDSSPATWANMINDLQHDPRIRERYHFWFFSYESGNPILYSAMLLRRALNAAVENLDNGPGDACLEHMVVLGHSQGGLLTKLTAVDSGDRFWDARYSRPFDKVKMRRSVRELLREALFVKPLPFVDRVVFIATPHHGSYLAGPQLVRRLAERLIQLPRDVVEVGADMASFGRFARPGHRLDRLSTSIDNMSPGNSFIRTLSDIPVADGVAVNSIVALRPGESKETGSDGVVKFSSAHLPSADSEVVVASGHSTLANPYTIEEVRRILLLHAAEQTCWNAARESSAAARTSSTCVAGQPRAFSPAGARSRRCSR